MTKLKRKAPSDAEFSIPSPKAPNEGDLRVWWIPQVPGESFIVYVDTIDEGRKVCEILAEYDLFQFNKNVKPDYSNAGGVQVYEADGNGGIDWFDAYNDEGDDVY